MIDYYKYLDKNQDGKVTTEEYTRLFEDTSQIDVDAEAYDYREIEEKEL